MGQVLSFDQYLRQIQRQRQAARRAARPLYFDKAELQQLIALYSEQVMAGEWRDYALDHLPGLAVFSVFRSTHERPLFAFAKRLTGPGAQEYLLFTGPTRLARGANLTDVVEAFLHFAKE